MQVSIIQIGNSKGLRLPKAILDKYNISEKVELIFEEEQIILKAVEQPRKGWDKAFNRMHKNGDDNLLLNDVFGEESFEEWK